MKKIETYSAQFKIMLNYAEPVNESVKNNSPNPKQKFSKQNQ